MLIKMSQNELIKSTHTHFHVIHIPSGAHYFYDTDVRETNMSYETNRITNWIDAALIYRNVTTWRKNQTLRLH